MIDYVQSSQVFTHWFGSFSILVFKKTNFLFCAMRANSELQDLT